MYSLHMALGGPQGRSGRVRNISLQPGFDPHTVEYVARRCTDWATPAHFKSEYTFIVNFRYQLQHQICTETHKIQTMKRFLLV